MNFRQIKIERLVSPLCLTLAMMLLILIFLEILLRLYDAGKNQPSHPPLHVVLDSPFLYGLNPEHPGISSQGLRDDEVIIPKAEGVFRILVLGDSIAYGTFVLKAKTFAERLEIILENHHGPTDVINAGVMGYTAYNELQYYLTKGRSFDPDIVIVAFCMNDVANPRLHWNYTKQKLVDIPPEAIPNHDYDINHVIPILQEHQTALSILESTRLYKALEWRIKTLFAEKEKNIPDTKAEIPTYITGEDTLSIKVLLDESSPEWVWLTSIYERLHHSIKADRGRLIIVLFPLAYQLDDAYPYFPQKKIAKFCKQNSIYCVDLLNLFRQYVKEDVFLLNSFGFYDIWHLTEFGHEITAKRIWNFLQENGLLRDQAVQK